MLEVDLRPICLKDFRNVVVLSGAGISVASGLKTFRGPSGLWNQEEALSLSSIDSLKNRPDKFWNFWGSFRKTMQEAQPNEAHLALSRWEAQIADGQRFTLITQNVDELHQRAGSRNVVEIHGSNFRTRCSGENCTLKPYADSKPFAEGAPKCALCSKVLRPDIVLFGEALPFDAMFKCKTALRDCDLFIAVGTSGTVYPASGFVEWAKLSGARTVLVNLEELESGDHLFEQTYLGKAEEILPELLK